MLRIFTAYRGISRVRLTRFEQRCNEDESSSVHRETVAFTMRVKPGLLEKPVSIRPRIKSKYKKRKNPSRGQNLDYDSWMTYVEKALFEILIFKYVYFDTMIDVTSESNVLGGYTSSIENGEVYKIQKLIGKRIRV